MKKKKNIVLKVYTPKKPDVFKNIAPMFFMKGRQSYTTNNGISH